MTGERDAELLARVAAGEVDEDAPEVRALLAGDAGARARLAELRALVARLDAAGADERADLAAARAAGGAVAARFDAAARALVAAPGERAPAAEFPAARSTAAERSADARPARGVLPLPHAWRPLRAAAAAIAAVSLVLVLARTRPGAPTDLPLGAPRIEIEIVEGAPPGTLSWSVAPPVHHWEITVSGVDAAGRDVELLPRTTTREPRWTPPPRAAAWPDRVFVDVTAVDASGAVRGHGTIAVELR